MGILQKDPLGTKQGSSGAEWDWAVIMKAVSRQGIVGLPQSKKMFSASPGEMRDVRYNLLQQCCAFVRKIIGIQPGSWQWLFLVKVPYYF